MWQVGKDEQYVMQSGSIRRSGNPEKWIEKQPKYK
jgi:hypothetical protein